MEEHKLVNGVKVPLTDADIKQREIDREEHRLDMERKRATLYQLKREEAYPSIGDQLDAILKQLNYMQMSGQVELIGQLDGIIGQWLAVKREYPKPTDVVK